MTFCQIFMLCELDLKFFPWDYSQIVPARRLWGRMFPQLPDSFLPTQFFSATRKCGDRPPVSGVDKIRENNEEFVIQEELQKGVWYTASPPPVTCHFHIMLTTPGLISVNLLHNNNTEYGRLVVVRIPKLWLLFVNFSNVNKPSEGRVYIWEARWCLIILKMLKLSWSSTLKIVYFLQTRSLLKPMGTAPAWPATSSTIKTANECDITHCHCVTESWCLQRLN